MSNIVEIVVTAKNLAKPAMEEATANARGLGGVVGKMAAVSGVALVGMAAESVKMASSFQSATTRLVTSAGETDKNIDMVRKGMLDMAGQVGFSAEELAKGMYTVESAGYHGSDGLKVLKAAAQGAKAENADLATVSNAVTDALTDYHLKADQAANVTSQLIKGVSFGKTTFEDFSGSMSNILPLAGSLNLKLADVTGVLAEMTSHGMSAQRASENEADAMRHLASPTAAMAKEFKALGITTQEVTGHLSKQGLAGTMEFLSQTAEKAGKIGTPEYTAALKKLMGTATGLNVALMTTGENSKSTQAAIKGIGGTTADAQGNVAGFAEVQKTLGQQVAQLKAGFDSLMIEIGNKLIPVITSVVGWMNKHKDVVVALAGIVAGLVIGFATYSVIMKGVEIATKLWAAAQWLLNAALDANPIGLIVIALAALALGLYEAYKHSKTFRDIVNEVGKVAKEAFTAVWHFAETAFNWLKSHWQLLLGILTGPIGMAVYLITHYWKNISDFAGKVVGWIDQAWHGLLSILEWPFVQAWNFISGIFNQIVSFIENLPSKISGVVSSIGHDLNPANWFATGGTVGAAATGGVRSGLTMVGEHGPELVRLPVGSTVHSNPDTRRMLAGGGGGGMVLEIRSGGSRMDDLIVEIIRKSVRIKGGNVQNALGQ